ncbi:MAG TPA: acyl-[acyl-carrier-protein]--UDP-N-acetylglucosamine O-acyltransferase, partial [Longimicrobiales bacterium]|nr:acyl-[acyl-carrier-protein]--UDP-N-acetylglucosamine O-acyltransferase [Longimicrobiales bacterium]
AFVGGASRVNKDVPPYVRAAGSPLEVAGLNSVGLRRRGFNDEVRRELKRVYRLFFASEYNVTQALERARSELSSSPELEAFLSFVETSERGVTL